MFLKFYKWYQIAQHTYKREKRCKNLLYWALCILVGMKYKTRFKYVVYRAIFYHLHNFKNVKNTHEGVLLLVKPATLLKVTLLLDVFTFFNLYKWYQIAQHTYKREKRCKNLLYWALCIFVGMKYKTRFKYHPHLNITLLKFHYVKNLISTECLSIVLLHSK